MEQQSLLAERKCKHLWAELGFSPLNGRIYKRCEKCGVIKEEIPPYIK